MKRPHLIIILLLSIFILPSKIKSQNKLVSEKFESLEPRINLNELETEFIKWWTYHSYNISLPSNFIGVDEKLDTINKKVFLKKLVSGNFIPLRLKSKDQREVYKLHRLSSSIGKNIRSTIKNEAITYLKYYNMEGKPFPEFSFTGLDGNSFTNENTKGKVTIIKTWFIHCKACIAEFPELNELVDEHKKRDDMIFISLALDSKSKLKDFLQKKSFKYSVVSDQKEFIQEVLDLDIYPTHIVLDKNGIIRKVVNKASEMISFLGKEIKLKKNRH
ncbi:MAG: TlpA family protein disulfide reductase [Flavobacteriaceae bacterium]